MSVAQAPTRAIRLLVVEDHTVVRKGLVSLLDTPRYGMTVVGEAGDGVEAVELARTLTPDVTLMDLVMPRKGGIEAIQEIRRADPAARILVLTSFGDAGLVAAALRAGAMGYLMKDSSPDDLLNAIRAIHAGNLLVPIDLARQADLAPAAGGSAAPGHAARPLTARETEVLRHLGRGMTNQAIGEALGISPYTVRAHVRGILAKLHLTNRTQAAIHALETGLVDREPGDERTTQS